MSHFAQRCGVHDADREEACVELAARLDAWRDALSASIPDEPTDV